MKRQNKIKVETMRFPIVSNLENVQAEVTARANEFYNDPSVLSVDVVPNHTSTYFVYDIIAELR